jgi:hypothetical protein
LESNLGDGEAQAVADAREAETALDAIAADGLEAHAGHRERGGRKVQFLVVVLRAKHGNDRTGAVGAKGCQHGVDSPDTTH